MNYKQIIIEFLQRRDGRDCQICRKPFLSSTPPEIDHIKPKFLGGIDSIENFQLVHHICNVMKGRKFKEDPDGQLLLIRKPMKIHSRSGRGEAGLRGQVNMFTVKLIADALARTDFHQTKAAARLGINYHALRHIIDKHGIERKESPYSPNGWVIVMKDGTVVWPTEFDPIPE